VPMTERRECVPKCTAAEEKSGELAFDLAA
jgi:hypothetical protein